MDEQKKEAPKREPMLDHEDWLYVIAICFIGIGAGCHSIGAGLISVGVLLLCWPIMARLCAVRNEVTK